VLVSKSYEKNPLLSLRKDKCERGYWRRSESVSVCRWVWVCCGFACECRSEFIFSSAILHSHPYFVHATFPPSKVFTFQRPLHAMNISRRSFRSSFQETNTVELTLLICFTWQCSFCHLVINIVENDIKDMQSFIVVDQFHDFHVWYVLFNYIHLLKR
jgi:hypothetical protein